MNVPEKIRDTTGKGRVHGPPRNNHLGRAGCVSHPSRSGAKAFSLRLAGWVRAGFRRSLVSRR